MDLSISKSPIIGLNADAVCNKDLTAENSFIKKKCETCTQVPRLIRGNNIELKLDCDKSVKFTSDEPSFHPLDTKKSSNSDNEAAGDNIEEFLIIDECNDELYKEVCDVDDSEVKKLISRPMQNKNYDDDKESSKEVGEHRPKARHNPIIFSANEQAIAKTSPCKVAASISESVIGDSSILMKKIKSKYQPSLQKVLKRQKNRVQKNIVIVTDERDNFDIHLSRFNKYFQVYRVAGLSFDNAFEKIKHHPNFGNGTMFVFSCGTHDLLQINYMPECDEFQCQEPIKIFDLPYYIKATYLIEKALKLNYDILEFTLMDIALFSGLIPVSINQFNEDAISNQQCLLHLRADNVPLINPKSYNLYSSAIGWYNKFCRFYSQTLGYPSWDLESSYFNSFKPIQKLSSNGFNLQTDEEALRANRAKLLCKSMIQSFSSQSSVVASLTSKIKKNQDSKLLKKNPNATESELTSEVVSSESSSRDCSLESDKKTNKRKLITAPAEDLPSKLMKVMKPNLIEAIRSVEKLYSADLHKIMQLQKNRIQNNIVIVTDDRENFDFTLANFDSRVTVLRKPGMNFSTAFSLLNEYNMLGKGTIFIFSCGIHNLLQSDSLLDCVRYNCSTPQIVLKYIPLKQNHHYLIEKAIKLNMDILHATENDMALFSGLIPVRIVKYNSFTIDSRPCRSVHPVKHSPKMKKPTYSNYRDSITWYSNFSRYHAITLGYSPWDMEQSYFDNRNSTLLPNCYNLTNVEERRRTKKAKILCAELLSFKSLSKPLDEAVAVSKHLVHPSPKIESNQELSSKEIKMNVKDAMIKEMENGKSQYLDKLQKIPCAAAVSVEVKKVANVRKSVEAPPVSSLVVQPEVIVEGAYDIQEPVKNRLVLVNNLSANTSAEAVKLYFQRFGIIVVGIHMKSQSRGSWKSALMIFSKSSMIEDVFKNKPHKIGGSDLQVHRSLWSRDKWRVNEATMFPATDVTKKEKAIDISSSMKTVQAKGSLKKIDYSKGNGEKLSEISVEALFQNNLDFIIEKQTSRVQNNVVIVTDGREELDQLLVDFHDRVEVLMIPNVNFLNAFDSVKMHPKFGTGTIFLFVCGIHDILISSPLVDCVKFGCSHSQTMLTISSDISEFSYLIKVSIDLHMNIVKNTDNDIAMFCHLIPVGINQYNYFVLRSRSCSPEHPASEVPLVDPVSRINYRNIVEHYNNFMIYYSQAMGYDISEFQENLVLKENGYNICSKYKERCKEVKLLLAKLLPKIQDSQPDAPVKEITSPSDNKDTTFKMEKSFIDNGEKCKNDSISCLENIKLTYDKTLLKIIAMQRNREQNNIVIVTDDRDRFDKNLTGFGNGMIEVLKISSLSYLSCFEYIKKHNKFGKGTIFIFFCGTHDILDTIPFNGCLKNLCPTPLTLFKFISDLSDYHHLIKRALNLHQKILQSTSNDIALFCGILPVRVNDYNELSIKNRPSTCVKRHLASPFFIKKMQLSNYKIVTKYYNEFTKYHTETLGFSPLNIEIQYLDIVKNRDVLLPDGYNICQEENIRRANQTKSFCSNLLPMLKFKADDLHKEPLLNHPKVTKYERVTIVADRRYMPFLEHLKKPTVLVLADEVLEIHKLKEYLDNKKDYLTKDTLYLLVIGIHTAAINVPFGACKLGCKSHLDCLQSLDFSMKDFIFKLTVKLSLALEGILPSLPNGSNFAVLPPLPVSLMSLNVPHKKLHENKSLFPDYVIANKTSLIEDWYPIWIDETLKLSITTLYRCFVLHPSIQSRFDSSYKKLEVMKCSVNDKPSYYIWKEVSSIIVNNALKDSESTYSEENISIVVEKSANALDVYQEKVPLPTKAVIKKDVLANIEGRNTKCKVSYDHLVFVGHENSFKLLPKIDFCSNSKLCFYDILDHASLLAKIDYFHKMAFKNILFVIISDLAMIGFDEVNPNCLLNQCPESFSYSKVTESEESLLNKIKLAISFVKNIITSIEKFSNYQLNIIIAPFTPKTYVFVSSGHLFKFHKLMHKFLSCDASICFLCGKNTNYWETNINLYEVEWKNFAHKYLVDKGAKYAHVLEIISEYNLISNVVQWKSMNSSLPDVICAVSSNWTSCLLSLVKNGWVDSHISPISLAVNKSSIEVPLKNNKQLEKLPPATVTSYINKPMLVERPSVNGRPNLVQVNTKNSIISINNSSNAQNVLQTNLPNIKNANSVNISDTFDNKKDCNVKQKSANQILVGEVNTKNSNISTNDSSNVQKGLQTNLPNVKNANFCNIPDTFDNNKVCNLEQKSANQIQIGELNSKISKISVNNSSNAQKVFQTTLPNMKNANSVNIPDTLDNKKVCNLEQKSANQIVVGEVNTKSSNISINNSSNVQKVLQANLPNTKNANSVNIPDTFDNKKVCNLEHNIENQILVEVNTKNSNISINNSSNVQKVSQANLPNIKNSNTWNVPPAFDHQKVSNLMQNCSNPIKFGPVNSFDNPLPLLSQSSLPIYSNFPWKNKTDTLMSTKITFPLVPSAPIVTSNEWGNINLNRTPDEVIDFARNILNLEVNSRSSHAMFENIYFVGKQELLNPLLDCNIKSRFIYHDFTSFELRNIDVIINKLGNIGDKSVCCLVFDFTVIAEEVVVSSGCFKYSCPQPLYVSYLRAQTFNCPESSAEISDIVFSRLQCVTRFIVELSRYIPVIILPLVPTRIFCDSDDPFNHGIPNTYGDISHKLSHTINDLGASVVYGPPTLWKKAITSLISSWDTLMDMKNRNYDSYNLICAYRDSNPNSFPIVKLVNDFVNHWSEPQLWKALTEAIVEPLLFKNENDRGRTLSLPFTSQFKIMNVSSSIPFKFLYDVLTTLDQNIDLVQEKDMSYSLKNVGHQSSKFVSQLNSHRVGDSILLVYAIDNHDCQPVSLNLMEYLFFSSIIEKVYNKWKSLTLDNMTKKINEVSCVASLKSTLCEKKNCCKGVRACPCYHSFLDKRRNPFLHRYTDTLCLKPKGLDGFCIEGVHCQLSHNMFETNFHPAQYQILPCPSGNSSSMCNNISLCHFAHRDSPEMLFTKEWEDLYIIGAHHSVSFFAGAIRAIFKIGDLSRTNFRVLLVSPSLEFLDVVISSTQKLMMTYAVHACILGKNTGNIESCQILVGEPCDFVKINRAILANMVGAIIVDDIQRMFENEKQRNDILQFFMTLRTPYYNINLHKVFVSATYSSRAANFITESIELKPKIVYIPEAGFCDKVPSNLYNNNNKAPSPEKDLHSQVKTISAEPHPLYYSNPGSTSVERGKRLRSPAPVRDERPISDYISVRSVQESSSKKMRSRSRSINRDEMSSSEVFQVRSFNQMQVQAQANEFETTAATQESSPSFTSNAGPFDSLPSQNSGTQLELRKRFGDKLFAEYLGTMETMLSAFEEECEVYRDVPELHPKFENFCLAFDNEYDVDNMSIQAKDDFRKIAWESEFAKIKKDDWLLKHNTLLKEFERKASFCFPYSNQDSQPLLAHHEEKTSSRFEESLNLLDAVSKKIPFLGLTVKAMIASCRELGTITKEAYDIFANSEAVTLLNLVAKKLAAMRLSTFDDSRQLYEKAINCIPIFLDEAKKGPKPIHPLKKYPIDIDQIAKISVGRGSVFALELIKSALTYEGIQNPSTELINDLFLKVCDAHFTLSARKNRIHRRLIGICNRLMLN